MVSKLNSRTDLIADGVRGGEGGKEKRLILGRLRAKFRGQKSLKNY